MSQNIIVGWVVFSGDLDPDPDAAALALEAPKQKARKIEHDRIIGGGE